MDLPAQDVLNQTTGSHIVNFFLTRFFTKYNIERILFVVNPSAALISNAFFVVFKDDMLKKYSF